MLNVGTLFKNNYGYLFIVVDKKEYIRKGEYWIRFTSLTFRDHIHCLIESNLELDFISGLLTIVLP